MRFTKLVDIDAVEVEVHIDHEDIAEAIIECPDSYAQLARTLNNIAEYFRSLPDEKISEFTDQQKNTIHLYLMELSLRFRQKKEKLAEADLSSEQLEILRHTQKHDYFCGGNKEIDYLVEHGYMTEAGRKPFVPDMYYSLTSKGKTVLSEKMLKVIKL